ncbi:cell surface protein [Leuconostoc citreum]|uniref:cell surface protein n=1 Tax=Leuconostoc citreum TaxID=33964 RepID=UPI0032DFBB91
MRKNQINIKTKLQKNWQTSIMLAGVVLPIASTAISTVHADNVKETNTTKADEQGINLDVNSQKLDEAAKKAADAGVKVDKKPDKFISTNSSDLEKNQKGISSDYDQQVSALEKAMNDQKKQDAEYQAKKDHADKVKKENADKEAKFKQDSDKYQKDDAKYQEDIKKYESETKTQQNADGKTQSNTSSADQSMDMDKSKPVDNSAVEGPIKAKQTFSDKPQYRQVTNKGEKAMIFGNHTFWGMGESTGATIYTGQDIIGKTFTKTYKKSLKVGGREADMTIAVTPTQATGKDEPALAISNNLIDNFNIVHASYKFQISFRWNDDGKELTVDELNGANRDSKLLYLGGSLTPHYDGKGNEYIQTNDAKTAFIGDKSFIANIKGTPQKGIDSYYAVPFDKTKAAVAAQDAVNDQSGKHPDENPDNFAQLVGVTFGDFTTNKPTFYGGAVNTQTGEEADLPTNHFMNYDAVAFNKKPIKPVKPTPPQLEPVDEHKKPDALTASYQKTSLLYTPTPTKDVKAGETSDANAKSIDKQQVKVGDKLTYSLGADDLPKDRKDDIKSLVYQDKLPAEIDYESASVTTKDGKKDLSKYVTFKFNKETREFTATVSEDYLKEINQAKNAVQQLPIIMLHVKANQANATFKNQYNLLLNKGSYKSNEVENKTTETPKSTDKPKDPEQRKTPNTSYGEKPKGLLYASIVTVVLLAVLGFFWKPIKKWFNK